MGRSNINGYTVPAFGLILFVESLNCLAVIWSSSDRSQEEGEN